jgi:hypothetical protein
MTASPTAQILGLKAFAAASRGYDHTFAIGEGKQQICLKMRRLTQAQLEELDYPSLVKPPAIPDAPEGAPYEERFNVEDPDYKKAWVRALLRKYADTIHAAIENGIPDEPIPAVEPAATAKANSSPVTSHKSPVTSADPAPGPDATDRRVAWVERNLPIPVRNSILQHIEEISSGEAVALAGFILPAA